MAGVQVGMATWGELLRPGVRAMRRYGTWFCCRGECPVPAVSAGHSETLASSPRARAIRSPARYGRAPRRWPRPTASRCSTTSRPRPTTSRSRPPWSTRRSAPSATLRIHAGRRQGDGAHGARRSSRPDIPLVNVSDRLAGGSAVAFVGSDDYGIALDTARTLLKAMGGKGNVSCSKARTPSQPPPRRLRGFKDALKEFPDVKVVLSKNAMYARPAAADLLKAMLKAEAGAASRRRACRQRRDGVRRDRGVQGGQEETAADRRHQCQQGSCRLDQGRRYARQRRLQRLDRRLPRRRDRDSHAAQAAGAQRGAGEDLRGRQEQLPLLQNWPPSAGGRCRPWRA